MFTLSAVILAYFYGQVTTWLAMLHGAILIGWLVYGTVIGLLAMNSELEPHINIVKKFGYFGIFLTVLYAVIPNKETVGLAILAGGGTAAAVAIVNNEEVRSIAKKTATVVENGLDALAAKAKPENK